MRVVAASLLGLVALFAFPAQAEDLPRGALPDAVMAKGEGLVHRAWLAEPTERYGHAILGDGIEAGALVVQTKGERTLSMRLPETSVFEDRAVRLADFDQDGVDELVVVESSLSSGAALAVYGIRDGELQLVARDVWIGRRNRWLNPAGIADFDGDGRLEVAIVVTPHIGGTLKLMRPAEAGSMTTVAAAWGFSNHAIGSRDQELSAVVDWDGDGIVDLLLPDEARDSVVAVSFAGGTIRELARYPLASSVDGNFVLKPDSLGPAVHVPLADGTQAILRPAG